MFQGVCVFDMRTLSAGTRVGLPLAPELVQDTSGRSAPVDPSGLIEPIVLGNTLQTIALYCVATLSLSARPSLWILDSGSAAQVHSSSLTAFFYTVFRA
jgi:hypothetical protein